MSKEQWLCGSRRAERSYSTFKVRRGGGEEIHLLQGNEQRLRFAGAAMKRYPMSKVREPQLRQYPMDCSLPATTDRTQAWPRGVTPCLRSGGC